MGNVKKPNIIFKNPMSQQEIDDYQQEREEGLGDPKQASNGNYYKHRTPENVPNLDQPNIQQTLSDTDKTTMKNDLRAAQNASDHLLENPPSRTSLTADRLNYINDIRVTKRSIAAIQHDLIHDQMIQDENRVESINVSNKNRAALSSYQDQLKYLNSGSYNMTQDGGESDEDYLQRMKDFGHTEISESEMLEKSKLKNIKDLKTNLKLIIRKDPLIQNVIKSLQQTEVYSFVKFRKLFADHFGVDNRRVSLDDVLSSIQTFLDTGIIDDRLSRPAIENGEDSDDETKDDGAGYMIESYHLGSLTAEFSNNICKLTNPINSDSIYLIIAQNKTVLFSHSGKKGSFTSVNFVSKSLANSMTKILKTHLQVTDEQMLTLNLKKDSSCRNHLQLLMLKRRLLKILYRVATINSYMVGESAVIFPSISP